jgi:TPR repeat protein
MLMTLKQLEKAIKNNNLSQKMVYDMIISFLKNMPPMAKDWVSWYRDQAERGDHKAQFILALMYHMGDVIYPNIYKARELYLKASDGNIAEAKFMLGVIYSSGIDGELDPKRASKFFIEAGELGLAIGQLYAGIEYSSGKYVEKDNDKVVAFYRKAADQGLPIAQFLLGVIYYDSSMQEKDNTEAFKWFVKSAEQNHDEAQYYLGLMYYRGEALYNKEDNNIFTFVSHMEPLNSPAHYRLGATLKQRIQMHFNIIEAFKLFHLSADKGNVKSMLQLSNMYLYGEGTPLDKEMSKKWRLRAEEAENYD